VSCDPSAPEESTLSGVDACEEIVCLAADLTAQYPSQIQLVAETCAPNGGLEGDQCTGFCSVGYAADYVDFTLECGVNGWEIPSEYGTELCVMEESATTTEEQGIAVQFQFSTELSEEDLATVTNTVLTVMELPPEQTQVTVTQDSDLVLQIQIIPGAVPVDDLYNALLEAFVVQDSLWNTEQVVTDNAASDAAPIQITLEDCGGGKYDTKCDDGLLDDPLTWYIIYGVGGLIVIGLGFVVYCCCCKNKGEDPDNPSSPRRSSGSSAHKPKAFTGLGPAISMDTIGGSMAAGGPKSSTRSRPKAHVRHESLALAEANFAGM
jgi:hypothetical protein